MKWIAVAAVIFVVFASWFIFTKSASPPIPSKDSSTISPTAEVTDFAPDLPLDQKTTVVIRHSDSSATTYLIPDDQVETFTSKLPEGDVVASKTEN